MCCSTIASYSLEDIAAVATGPLWFQLYVYRDREVTRDLVRRAESAGYRALVLTVDTPRLGRRERDIRNRFTLPADVSIRNLERYGKTDALRWAQASSFTEYESTSSFFSSRPSMVTGRSPTGCALDNSSFGSASGSSRI